MRLAKALWLAVLASLLALVAGGASTSLRHFRQRHHPHHRETAHGSHRHRVLSDNPMNGNDEADPILAGSPPNLGANARFAEVNADALSSQPSGSSSRSGSVAAVSSSDGMELSGSMANIDSGTLGSASSGSLPVPMGSSPGSLPPASIAIPPPPASAASAASAGTGSEDCFSGPCIGSPVTRIVDTFKEYDRIMAEDAKRSKAQQVATEEERELGFHDVMAYEAQKIARASSLRERAAAAVQSAQNRLQELTNRIASMRCHANNMVKSALGLLTPLQQADVSNSKQQATNAASAGSQSHVKTDQC